MRLIPLTVLATLLAAPATRADWINPTGAETALNISEITVFEWLGDNRDRVVDHERVKRLMRQMVIEALYPKRNTSRRNQAHRVYPYLLKGLAVERPNQVWAADVTCIPMARGFLYPVAIIDWSSRKVLSWRLSNTLGAEFCIAALEEALSRHGQPEIFNTDQGSQFTSEAFTSVIQERDIRISMDGKGRWVDNVFVERLWSSLKYEEVYLRAYESVAEAKAAIDRYFRCYNSERRNRSLARRTPDSVYYEFADLQRAADALGKIAIGIRRAGRQEGPRDDVELNPGRDERLLLKEIDELIVLTTHTRG